MAQLLVALILVAVFALLVRETAHRVLIAMSGVAVLFAVTYLTPLNLISFEQAKEALDINVLVLLSAMMAIVGVLKTTGVFEWTVGRLLLRSGGRPMAILSLVVWFTAITSALLDNVTTVIFITPMVLAMCRTVRIPPTPLLLAMVMASNIGGTATLIGDPPNILIGSGAHLSFMDFIVTLTAPCAVMVVWLLWYTRRHYATIFSTPPGSPHAGEDVSLPALRDPLLMRWMLAICAFVLVGFLTHHLTGMPPAVPALIGAAAALVVQDTLYVRGQRPTISERIHGVLQVTEEDIEWPTLAFFGFLFIIVGAADHTGLIRTLAEGLQRLIGTLGGALGLSDRGTLLLAALLVCWGSGVFSALIDNIPFVAVSIPIIAQTAATMTGETTVLWWALSLGACLGGNATVIGASANVTTVGLAERQGVQITFAGFARYATPVAVGTLVLASLFLAAYVWAGATVALLGTSIIFAFAFFAERASRPRPPEAAVRG